MDRLTLFFLERGSAFQDASDFAFLIIAGLIIVGIIVLIRFIFFLYRNPPEWDNIDWQGFATYILTIGFIILVIYVILHFVIKYW